MEIISYHKYLRIKPAILKSLAKSVVGLSPQKAIDRLEAVEIKVGKHLLACIKSALSNAEKNKKLDGSLLRIKAVEIQKGPFFKRWQPVSRGIAHQIQKRTAHIKVKLEEIKSQVNSKTKEIVKETRDVNQEKMRLQKDNNK